jgi:hypothetical protein
MRAQDVGKIVPALPVAREQIKDVASTGAWLWMLARKGALITGSRLSLAGDARSRDQRAV